jgi:hypothetical protein
VNDKLYEMEIRNLLAWISRKPSFKLTNYHKNVELYLKIRNLEVPSTFTNMMWTERGCTHNASFQVFAEGITDDSVPLAYAAASLDNRIPKFRGNVVSHIHESIRLRHFDPTRCGHYVLSKRREPITHIRTVISQRNGIVYISGSQTFSVHRPLGSICTPTGPPYLF